MKDKTNLTIHGEYIGIKFSLDLSNNKVLFSIICEDDGIWNTYISESSAGWLYELRDQVDKAIKHCERNFIKDKNGEFYTSSLNKR